MVSTGPDIGRISKHGGKAFHNLRGVHDWLSVTLTLDKPVAGSHRFDLPAACVFGAPAVAVGHSDFLVTPTHHWPLQCSTDEVGELAGRFTDACFQPAPVVGATNDPDEQRRQFRVQAGKHILRILGNAHRAVAPSGLRLLPWKPAWESPATEPEPVRIAPGLSWLASGELLDRLAANPEHQFNLAMAIRPTLHPELHGDGSRTRIPRVYLPDPEQAANPDYQALTQINEPLLESGAPRRLEAGHASLVSPVRLKLRTTDAAGRADIVRLDLPCGIHHTDAMDHLPLGLVIEPGRIAPVHAHLPGIIHAAHTVAVRPDRRGIAARHPVELKRIRKVFRETLEAATLAELPPDLPAYGKQAGIDACFMGENPDRHAVRQRLLEEAEHRHRSGPPANGRFDQMLAAEDEDVALDWVRSCPDVAVHLAPVAAASCLADFTADTLRETRDEHATRFPDRRHSRPDVKVSAVLTEVSTTVRNAPRTVVATIAVPIPPDRLREDTLDGLERVRRDCGIEPHDLRKSPNPVYAPLRICFPETQATGTLEEGTVLDLDCAELNRIAARTAGVPACGERVPEEGPGWAYRADGTVGERRPTGTVLTGPSLSDAIVFKPEKPEHLTPFAGHVDMAALGLPRLGLVRRHREHAAER